MPMSAPSENGPDRPPAAATNSQGGNPQGVAHRRRRNLWLGLGLGLLALSFYGTIILKTGVLGLPPGFR